MAKQSINIGSAANDGTGSTLRAAFDICNDNFTELYDGSGGLLHKIEGANFTGSLLVGHSTTGTLSSALGNTGVGIATLNALTSGDYNVAVGNEAGGAITSGERNVLMGYAAGDAITISSYNTAVGHGALSTEDTRHGSTAIGYKALNIQNADADPYNTAVGYHAAFLLTTGVYNTILGGLAGDALTTGNSNIAIGLNALGGEDTGHDSVAIGRSALLSQNYDGSAYNVAIGRDAGRLVDTGIKNTIIGGLAGDNLTTGSNNILIGYDATASAVGVSNEVTIGDSNISTVRIPSDSTLKIGASGDLQLEHLSSNSFIKNTAVGDLYIENQVDDASIIFRCDDGSGGLDTYFSVVGAGNRVQYNKDLRLIDNVELSLGSSDDLKIYHNSSNSYIENDTNDLIILNNANDKDIVFQCDDGSGGVETYFRLDGSAEQTQFTKNTEHQDSVKALFGTGSDMEIFHDASNSYIENYTGTLNITQHLNDGDIRFKSDDGSGGTETYFFLDGSIGKTKFPDSKQLVFGDSSDLRIYHDGTDSKIHNDTGHLIIEIDSDDKDLQVFADDGSGGLAEYFRIDGSLEAVRMLRKTRWNDNIKATFGDSDDLKIYHDGSSSHIENQTSNLTITNYADDGDIIFRSDDGSGGHTTYFYLDGSLASGGSVFTVFPDNSSIVLGTGNDLQAKHNGTDTTFDNYTGNLKFQNYADDKDIVFSSDDGSGGLAEYFKLDGSSASGGTVYTNWADNSRITLGAGNDMQLYHDGSNNYVDITLGDLYFTNYADDKDIIFRSDDGSGGVTEYFRLDGSTNRIDIPDSIPLCFGTADDLQIQHNGSTSYIQNYTGNLVIENNLDDGDIIFKSDNGSGGLATYFFLDGSNSHTNFQLNARWVDNSKAQFGNSGDLEIFHDGSHSYLVDTGTGQLRLKSDSEIQFLSDTNDIHAKMVKDGAVELYYDNVKKFETTSSGVKLPQAGEGITLVSPDGNTTRTLTIDNSGNLVVGT